MGRQSITKCLLNQGNGGMTHPWKIQGQSVKLKTVQNGSEVFVLSFWVELKDYCIDFSEKSKQYCVELLDRHEYCFYWIYL